MAITKKAACTCGRWVKAETTACTCGEKIAAKATVRYEVVVDGPRDAQGKRKQMRRRFSTLKEAKAWEASTTVEIDKGTFVGREKISLAAYLDAWEAGLEQKATTASNYRTALLPVRRMIGGKMLQQVTKDDVESVKAAMKNGTARVKGDKPLSPAAIRLTLVVLAMAMQAAVVEGRLPRNVAAMVAKPALIQKKRSVWETAEVAKFLAVSDLDRLAGAWRLSLTGLRRGEVMGLSWDDVALDEALVTIRNSRVLVDGQPVLQASTKSEAGERVVPLSDAAVAALRRTSAVQAAEKLAAGEGAYQDCGLVAVDALGRPVPPRWYGQRFQALSRAAGVPVVRLHDARHAYGSHLLAQGVPLPLVSEVMGHASTDITARVYAHALKDGAQDRVRLATAAAGL